MTDELKEYKKKLRDEILKISWDIDSEDSAFLQGVHCACVTLVDWMIKEEQERIEKEMTIHEQLIEAIKEKELSKYYYIIPYKTNPIMNRKEAFNQAILYNADIINVYSKEDDSPVGRFRRQGSYSWEYIDYRINQESEDE